MNAVAAPSSTGTAACAGPSSRGACAPAAGDDAPGADFAALLMAAAPAEGAAEPVASGDPAAAPADAADTAGDAAVASPLDAAWLAHLLPPPDAAAARAMPAADSPALMPALVPALAPSLAAAAAPSKATSSGAASDADRLPGGRIDLASAGLADDAAAHASGRATAPGLAAAEPRAAGFAELLASADAGRSVAPAMDAAHAAPPLLPGGATLPHAAGPTSLTPAAPAAGGTPSLPLAAPFGSPEFAPALGAQVTVLARDGVQRAELRLNPADMGPIAVQIALDGAQATVHFAADVAATRAALESSWPELAGALRDAGLTLAGGGVSEQPRQRRDGAGDAAPGARADARTDASDDGAPGDAAQAALPRPRARGVVDLVA